MNSNQNKLRNLLELIQEQVEVIARQQDEVPQLYLDMVKENLIKLYEEIHLLEKAKKGVKSSDLLIPEVEKPTPEIIKEVPEPVEQPKAEAPIKKEEIIVEGKAESEIQPKIERANWEIKVEAPKVIEQPIEIKPVKKVIESNDLFKSQLSIGEKLQAQQEPALVDKFQKKQIEDIKSAIGINEKFLFINELFDGDMQKYNQSIDKLDCAATKEDAVQIIEQLDTEFQWDEESEAREKLLLFIDRRY